MHAAMQEKEIKTKSDSPLGATIAEDLYKNPPSIMDTMTGTAGDKDDKVDVFGGNRAAALGASIFLAVILLIGTIGLPDSGGQAPKAPQVLPHSRNHLDFTAPLHLMAITARAGMRPADSAVLVLCRMPSQAKSASSSRGNGTSLLRGSRPTAATPRPSRPSP